MNFKYKIGDITNKGKIIARFYKEWLNRNGGPCSGYFYEMDSGKSFNQILVELNKDPIIHKYYKDKEKGTVNY